MPKRSSKPKRPKDINQFAKLVMDVTTGERQDILTTEGKNPAAVALGRLGGQKGGVARAVKLSAAKRKRIAKHAAKARWGKRARWGK